MALARKAPSLLALNPDIAVVQECSEKSIDVLHSHGLSGLWFGANPNKGVGVFGSKEFAVQVAGKPFGKWVVPVRTDRVSPMRPRDEEVKMREVQNPQRALCRPDSA
jgi:hypothetical protein